MLTKEQVEALEATERRLYGDGGDVKSALGLEREKLGPRKLAAAPARLCSAVHREVGTDS